MDCVCISFAKGFTSAFRFQRAKKQTEQMERLLKKHKGCAGTKVIYNKKIDWGVQSPKNLLSFTAKNLFFPHKVSTGQCCNTTHTCVVQLGPGKGNHESSDE